MIHVSVEAFFAGDTKAALSLKKMEDVVDKEYKDHIKRIAASKRGDSRCTVAVTLAIRYLERMADHATYIGDSVIYVASGERSSLR